VRRSFLLLALLLALIVCASVPSGAIADDKPAAPPAKPAADPAKPAADPRPAPGADKPAAEAAPTATQPNANPAGSRPAAGPANRAPKVKVDYVVAIVNDAIILNSELEARRVPVMTEAQQIADPKERERRIAKLTSQVLDEMVNDELEVQAAEAAKIEVESSEVQAALDDIKQQNNLDDAGLAAALSAQGFTLANYKQEVRRQMLRLRAENQMITPKIQVSEEDVRARYDQMARRTEQVQAVKLSHMLFKLPEHPTEQQVAEAKEKAAKAIARVRAGEEFTKVAQAESEDDTTKTTGGELGWFQRGSMANPEWEPVVFAMEKGDVRGPVTGPQGFHVFQVTEIKRSDLKPFNEMKEQLNRELRRREQDKLIQNWRDDLRKKAYIDIKLT
jgi:parvulin-like peptidyl-prolyl isomerase